MERVRFLWVLAALAVLLASAGVEARADSTRFPTLTPTEQPSTFQHVAPTTEVKPNTPLTEQTSLPGTTVNDTECTPCRGGFFKPYANSSLCQPCPADAVCPVGCATQQMQLSESDDTVLREKKRGELGESEDGQAELGESAIAKADAGEKKLGEKKKQLRNAAAPSKAFRAGFRAGFRAQAHPAVHPAKAAEAEKAKIAAEKADSKKKEEALKLELKGKKVEAQARAKATDAAKHEKIIAVKKAVADKANEKADKEEKKKEAGSKEAATKKEKKGKSATKAKAAANKAEAANEKAKKESQKAAGEKEKKSAEEKAAKTKHAAKVAKQNAVVKEKEEKTAETADKKG